MKKFVIYTAIFGKPNRFNFPKVSKRQIDKFCYTDLKIIDVPFKDGHHQMIPLRRETYIENKFYEMKKIKVNQSTPVRKQRFVKICIPDEIFDNYEYSVYVDCKYRYSVDFNYLLSCMEHESDIVTRRHRRRGCVYDEGEFCIKRKKDKRNIIQKQLDFYRSENYPAHNRLYATGLLVRRHTERLKEFSKLWWKQVERFSHRDQLSLPYVAWKHDMKISLYGRKK